MKKIKLTFVFGLLSLIAWSQCNVIATSDEDYCGTDEVTFTAFIPAGTCDFKWYAEETGGTELGTGCNFNATGLDCGTYTYYVEDPSVIIDKDFIAGYSIGVAPMTGAGNTNQFGANYFRTFFTTDKEMVFNSVTIEFKDRNWGCDANKIFIDLIEEDGTVHTFPIFVPCGGGTKHTVVVPMGVTIPAGDHEIKLRDQYNLVTYYNSGADYSAGGPLDYADGLHITGNAQNDGVWGGLFDWDVTAKSYCDRTKVEASSSCTPAEIAGNGIDDDCDGLVDCFDPDVFDDPACADFYFGGETPECMEIPDLEFSFDIQRAWKSTERVETRQTPVVGDLDGDGFPEVVTLFNKDEVIRVFDGRDGSLKTEITHTSSYATEGAGIADIDGDGFGEIFAVDKDGILRAYTHDGSPLPGFIPPNLINGAANDLDNAAHPSFIDFDGDGNPEIYIGTEIYEAKTGALVAKSPDPVNDPNGTSGFGHKFPVAFDILPDGHCAACSGAELITGSTVYSVDLSFGDLIAVAKIPTTINGDDGSAALADWNGDGLMDIVAGGSCCGDGGVIAVWDPRTEAMIMSDAQLNAIIDNPADASTANNQISLVQIADFDGDGFPEAAVATGGKHVVLDGDLTRMWEQTFVDVSGITASTSFDFEGDGITEIIYRDEQDIYVLDGATGAIRASFECGSGTRTETPVIADVDADGEAEIVCNCADSDGTGRGHLTVFESIATPWMPTRSVWNQVNYSPVFVNDDLTIPNIVQNKALIPGLDIYLSQAAVLTEDGIALRPALPDFVVEIDSTFFVGGDCSLPNAKAAIEICNEDFKAHVYDFDVTLYAGDPLAGGVLLSTTRVTDLNTTVSSPSCFTINIDIPAGDYELFAVVNDDGSSPVDAPELTIEECDSTNNIDDHPVITCETCNVNLQEVDSAICIGDSVVLDAFVLAASGTGTWSIDSMPTGSVNVFLNEWADTVFNAEDLGATPGTYKLIFTNVDGANICEDSIYITINGLPTVDLGADRLICPIAPNEIFDADVFDEYNWYYDAAGNTQTYETNLEGNYAIEVTDANGCVDSDTVVLSYHALPIPDLGLDQTICPGDSFEFDAGVFDSYAWYQLGTGTNQTLWAKDAGEYSVEVTDANGCKDSDTVVLSHHILPVADLGLDQTICPGDSFEFDAGGFDTYSWYQLGASTNQTIWAKAEGEYSVEITDANGCVDSDTVVLAHHALPVVDLGLDRTICLGAPNEVFDAGVFAAYNWYYDAVGNTQNYESNLAGSFAVEVKDANGCVDSDTVALSYYAGSEVDLGLDQAICPGDSFEFDAGAFVTYEWWGEGSGINQTVMGKTAGEYIVEVEDVNGCMDTDTVVLAFHAQPDVDLGADRSICPGAPNEIFDAGIFDSYSWYMDAAGASQTYESNLAGNFALAVTNAEGCVDSDTVVLVIYAQPVVDLGPDDTICFGAPNANFNAGVFANYNWYLDAAGKTQNYESNLAGSFAVEVIDANGCVDSDTVNLGVIALPVPELDDQVVCPGMDHEFIPDEYDDGTGAYTYAWNTGANTETITTDVAGNYWVDITNRYGCIGRAEAELIIDGDLDVTILSGVDIELCEGEDTVLNTNYTAAAGFNFTWSDLGAGRLTETITTDPVSGRYEVRVDNGMGCEGTAEINITVNPLPILVPGVAEFCEGDAINIGLGMGAGYTYEWSTGEITEEIEVNSMNIASPYDITVTNTLTGCESQTTYVVTENPLPEVNVRDTAACEGEVVTLENTFNTAGMDHEWTGGLVSETINPVVSGPYTLIVRTAAGCEASDDAEVIFNPIPIVDLGPDTVTICEGESHVFDAGRQIGLVEWNTGSSEEEITAVSDSVYVVSVTQDGCETIDSARLIVVDLPVSKIDHSLAENAICFEDVDERGLAITANDNPVYDFLWNTGEVTSTILIEGAGEYQVEISVGTCSVRDSITIRDYCPWSLYLPNAFTPNDDGLNDEFPSSFYGEFIDYELLIFNRWGEQIYQTNDINSGWDGTYMGNDCQIDVYVYKISYRTQEELGLSERISRVGRVSLIR